jgi:class 3 adenylate cyclase
MNDKTQLKAYTKHDLIQMLTLAHKQIRKLKEKNHDLNKLLDISSEYADSIQTELLSDKQDLEMIIEMSAEHSDTVQQELLTDNKDLEMIIEMSAEHSDTIQQELLTDNEDLEMMIEMSAEYSDTIQQELLTDNEDLEMMIEMSAEHADLIAAELEEKKQAIRNTFGRYVSSEIVDAILDNKDGLKLGGERKKVTILTSDLRGFTRFSEKMSPEVVVKILNYYFARMESIISEHLGIIDEFMGDGILVLFGAPISKGDDAFNAVACALKMQLAMDEINQQMALWGFIDLDMGIGVHTGEVIVGNIGSEKRTKYGIVGANVNLTYRIESYSTGGQILISQQTYDEVADQLQIFNTLKVFPKGIKKEITIYNIKGLSSLADHFLPEPILEIPKLKEAISLQFTLLDGKHMNENSFPGLLTYESSSHAFIKISKKISIPKALENIKITMLGKDDIYAKVVVLDQALLLDTRKHNIHGFFLCYTAK